MKASSITDGSMKKIQLLAMGGLELQNVFDGIPGADMESEESADPFAAAKAKLDNHFSPKQHESFERYLFWMMSPETEEPIEKFVERVQQKAEKCTFGKSVLESRQIAVVDKIIQFAPGDLREKLLEKENLTLDESSRNTNVFKKPRSVMHIETPEDNNEGSDEEELPVYNVGDTNDELIQCRVGGVNIEMLIDSGSKFNLIDDTTWQTMNMRNVKAKNLRTDTSKKFLAYGKVPLKVVVVFDAEIEILGTDRKLAEDTTFYVIEKGQQPLLGKISARQLGVLRIGLGSTEVNRVDVAKHHFPYIRDVELTLPIDRSVPPVIQPLRRCPVPLLDKVKAKLDDLLAQDIIERVGKPTSWVSPLVPILKDNGDLRMCIDMRRANQAIQRLNHPLPVFEEILPRIRNARFYSLLDMKESYYHVMLSEGCRDVTTFITNWGLYRFKSLFFGVNCAPELFQSLMESLLAACPNLIGFIDDFLVFGDTEEAHDNALRTVVRRFEELGVQLNHQKCKFKQLEVVFLGHRLSEKGVLPSDDKIRSILNCRSPKSKEELRSFLGLVTFVSRFIPDLATANHPLRELVKQSTNYVWDRQHEDAFNLIKQQIGCLEHLGYYDPTDRTLVVTDASGVGLGAVLIQFKTNNPRVISFASKSLSETEMKYPPIEKEALAIVWAVERFRIYLIGITFELETDHRPLETVFTKTSRPTLRIERWLLRLQAFSFNVVYRKGSANLADCLSRLASHVDDPSWNEESEVYIRRVAVETLALLNGDGAEEFDKNTEIEIKAIQEAAAIDISEVVQETKCDEELGTNELSYMNGLVMRGSKLVIPLALRDRMCQIAHEGHPGQSAMKSRLRDKCWWPNMDKEIIKLCEACEGCRLVHSANPPEPMSRRSMPEKPWIDLAIDFLGPLPSGEYILVVIDYFSRYMELEIMTRITAQETIQRLKRIFRTWGYPRTITLDNGKQFVSKEFETFCEKLGIHLNHSSPYWPQANGEVERQNRSLLKRLKISNALYGNWKVELDDYLILYNNSPHSVTGRAPSELLQSRKLRYKLPQMDDLSSMPPSADFRDRDTQKKFEGKIREDARRGAKRHEIKIGDTVLMKNLHPKDKLSTNFLKEKFSVVDKKGSNITVQSEDNEKRYERNTSHLHKISEPLSNDAVQMWPEDYGTDAMTPKPLQVQNQLHHNSPLIATQPIDTESEMISSGDSHFEAPIRRSGRVPKPKCCYSP
ncbi:uncharacterized protein K02A2.6-like [Topomyia yanbarensis]|uniref:uncharacterized protein K02A2.6-like n=1 Tax=Topomyia yanbarensis TaxID=2498891 RepID=UPI00273BC64E|nr:uncharacterized protein K02A2.6-like [Topomyia yanbarensis]